MYSGVIEEHMQRAKVEDTRTVEWQKEELAKNWREMEEEVASQTDKFRTEAKNAIEQNLQEHQHEALQQKQILELETKHYLQYRISQPNWHI